MILHKLYKLYTNINSIPELRKQGTSGWHHTNQAKIQYKYQHKRKEYLFIYSTIQFCNSLNNHFNTLILFFCPANCCKYNLS